MLLALAAGLLVAQPSLDSILDDPKLSGAVVSALVADLDGNILYARNESTRVVPASNQKLVTSAFALHKLGANYHQPTRFWRLGDRIVVDSPGDPLLTYENLLRVKEGLGASKSMPVYVRQPYRPLLPPAWEWDDLPNKYAAPVTAFTVDRGSFELWTKAGRPHLRPRNYGVRVMHVPGSQPARIVYEPWKSLVTVLGRVPDGEQRLDTLAIPYPDLAAASILGSSLHFTSELPSGRPTVVFSGTPMSELLKECLTESDNQVAEHLLLKAGGVEKTHTDPYEEATEVLNEFLTTVVGTDEADFRPHDGSGLSRHNFVTARGIVKLLAWADKQPWRDLWHASLVQPGNGTLTRRMADLPFKGKTGTLDAVVALSGYLTLKDGRRVIVALFLNHYACPTVEARDFVDQFVNSVLILGNEGTLFAEPHEYEVVPPYSSHGASDRYRFSGSDRNRRAA